MANHTDGQFRVLGFTGQHIDKVLHAIFLFDHAAHPDLTQDELDALSLLLSAAFDRAAQAIAEGADQAPLLAGILNLITGVTQA